MDLIFIPSQCQLGLISRDKCHMERYHKADEHELQGLLLVLKHPGRDLVSEFTWLYISEKFFEINTFDCNGLRQVSLSTLTFLCHTFPQMGWIQITMGISGFRIRKTSVTNSPIFKLFKSMYIVKQFSDIGERPVFRNTSVAQCQ